MIRRVLMFFIQDGSTALAVAVEKNHHSCLEVLVNKGANIAAVIDKPNKASLTRSSGCHDSL